jgi:hypothetical protein
MRWATQTVLKKRVEAYRQDSVQIKKLDRQITQLTEQLQRGDNQVKVLEQLAEAYRLVGIVRARMDRFETRAQKHGFKKYRQYKGFRTPADLARTHQAHFEREAERLRRELKQN